MFDLVISYLISDIVGILAELAFVESNLERCFRGYINCWCHWSNMVACSVLLCLSDLLPVGHVRRVVDACLCERAAVDARAHTVGEQV